MTGTGTVVEPEAAPNVGAASGEPRGERIARFILAAVAAVLVVLAARLPVWEARLDVKQYPTRPLELIAYGDRLEGDVAEVKILNHYVGLHVFDMAELPETALWIPAIAFALGCVIVAAWIPRRGPGRPKPPRSWLGTLARIGLWAVPAGILLDIQFRLYELGHSIDPNAPITQPEFTPPVVGKAQVASNVMTTAWPGRAVQYLLIAAFLITFGMSLFRFGKQLLGIGPAVRVAAAGLLVLGAISLTPPAIGAPADTIDVQALLDATPEGGSVTIGSGVHEGPVVVRRSMTIVGEPGAVLDGLGEGSVLTIEAPDVDVSGLLVTGGDRFPVGANSAILVTRDGDRAHLHDLQVEDSYMGITVQRASGVVIERVHIRSSGIIEGELHVVGAEDEGEGEGAARTEELRGDGVWLFDSVDSVVRDSVIETVRDGVQLTYGSGAVVEDVTVRDSRFGLHDMFTVDATFRGNRLTDNLNGIVMMYGGPVLIEGNLITENGSASTGFGVLVKDAGGVVLRDNVVADNRVGVYVDDAGRTGLEPAWLESNTIAVNQVGVLLVPSADSTFTGNAFIENTTQVALAGTGRTQAVWSVGGVGNHWSDYGGFDAEGDGIGDLAYTRSGATSRLIAEQPILLALASGPAFRLLTSVEDKWATGEPIVQDDAPLVDARIPTILIDDRSPAVPLWLPGAVLTLGSVALLTSGRRSKGVRVRG